MEYRLALVCVVGLMGCWAFLYYFDSGAMGFSAQSGLLSGRLNTLSGYLFVHDDISYQGAFDCVMQRISNAL